MYMYIYIYVYVYMYMYICICMHCIDIDIVDRVGYWELGSYTNSVRPFYELMTMPQEPSCPSLDHGCSFAVGQIIGSAVPWV